LPLGVQVAELVPGGQGRVIELTEAEAETVGGWLGGFGGVLALRLPTHN
jgi:hypothetical protein